MKQTKLKPKGKRSSKTDTLDERDRKPLRGLPCAFHPDILGVHLHHIRAKQSHPELRHEPLNHVKVCEECHDLAHNHGAAFRELLDASFPGRWDELSRLSRELSKGIQ